MPVIVIGADTTLGHVIVDALLGRQGEVRAFVTDHDAGVSLKQRGVKVAVGDVSDASHVASACLGAFTAVLVPDAALDGRERSFAPDAAAVLEGWAAALAEAEVRRIVILDDGGGAVPAGLERAAPEVATVATAGVQAADVAAEVARLDEAAQI